MLPSQVNGTSRKLYEVPPVRPFNTYDVAGAVGKLVGVIVMSVPTPAAGAFPFADDNVGEPVP